MLVWCQNSEDTLLFVQMYILIVQISAPQAFYCGHDV